MFGMENVWLTQSVDEIGVATIEILGRMQSESKEQDYADGEKLQNFGIYMQGKHDSEREKYLNFDVSLDKIRVMAQVRLFNPYASRIFIGENRYTFTSHHLCTICNIQQKEDLVHLLKECQIYRFNRERHIPIVNNLNLRNFYKILIVKNKEDLFNMYSYIVRSCREKAFILNE